MNTFQNFKLYRKIIFAILLVLLFLFIFSYIIGCQYIVYYSDDINSLRYLKSGTIEDYSFNLFKSLKHTFEVWKTWQGTFGSELIGEFFSDITRPLGAIRNECAIITVMFFCSIILTLKEISLVLSNGIKDRLLSIVVVFSFICTCFINLTVKETFFWYTGSYQYTLLFSISFFAFFFFLKYIRTHRKPLLFFSCFFAFWAGGGPLDIAAFNCATFLGFSLIIFSNIKRIDKMYFPFAFSFFGALLNSLAPGYWNRFGALNEIVNEEVQFSLGRSIAGAAMHNYIVFYQSMCNGTLIILTVVLFVLGVKYLNTSKIKFDYPLLAILYCGFAMLITTFPIVFAYNGYFYTDRNIFVDGVTFFFSWSIMIIYISGWCAQKLKLRLSGGAIIAMALCCVISCTQWLTKPGIYSMVPARIYISFFNGDLQSYLDKEMEIIDTIKNSKERDVVIKDHINDLNLFTEFDMREDSSYFLNEWMAEYCGKDSVVYIDTES